MTASDIHLLLRGFCAELGRSGVAHACTSPGSRCAPLVLALVREPELRCWSHIDERCAGFFALGVAKATGMPAVVACTSGTATANLAPAVHEAREARVPLVVLTADRPPELRDIGAGQSIDQLGLYGRASKWFFEVGDHAWSPEREAWMRTLACRAVALSLSDRPGPVHLNFALREPLLPGTPLPPDRGGRAGRAPWVARSPARVGAPETVDGTRRGIVVAGRDERGLAVRAGALAEGLGWPVLADPLSGARRGPAAIAHYDALLRDPAWAARHAPEVVLRVGDLPTSKPLRAWLAALEAEQLAVDPEQSWQDPAGVVARRLGALPASAGPAAPEDWLAAWRDADRAAGEAIEAAVGAELSEPRVAMELGTRLPAGATLVVASSMPVRDVESFFGVRPDPPRVLCNRGANGIDGTVSTAFGVAATAAPEQRTVLLIGDVALAHDLGGLVAARRLGLDLTIVLVHNDGGGIFDFLPIAGEHDVFEEHVATPHGLDFAHAAALVGARHERVEDLGTFRLSLDAALASPGTSIVEVPSDRAANVELHAAAAAAVSQALAAQPQSD